MIEITRSLEVPGTPDQVIALIADFDRWPEWFALHKGWAGDPPGFAEDGLRFKQNVRVLGIPGEVSWTVTDFELPERIELRGKGTSRTSLEVDFRIAPSGDESSEVSFTARLGGLALRPLQGRLRPWVVERADRSLAALSELLATDTSRA